MTSSLVGSEMCIRDSHGTMDTNGTMHTTGPTKTTDTAGAACVATAPVSYTHLTLPTICSV
eukprot:9512692-Prorocentrum_lima.AAC.1